MDKKYFKFLTLILISSFIFFSCEEDADPADIEVPTPVITSISPVEGYPGEEVTITGENFNAVA